MKKVLGTLVLIFLAAFPKIFGIFSVLFMTEVFLFAAFAMSFNLLFGYTGLLSFGHAAFFGIGGYTAALLALHTRLSLVPILGAVFLTSLIASLVIGFLCVRRDEIYFAMLTLAFGMMVHTLVYRWRSVTGGSDGLSGFEIPCLNLGFAKLSLVSPSSYYYLSLAFLLVVLFFLHRLVNSPFGLVLRSIRENKERALFVGADVKLYRLWAFVIAGVTAGLTGALFVFFDRMASPSIVHWTMSARPVLMAVLGGAKTFLGPAVGAFIFFALEHVVTQFTESWMIFLGVILVPIVLFFPDGVVGSLEKFLRSRRRT